MTDADQPPISLRPWAEGDLSLLQKLLGDPAMTLYLGRPETQEQLARRHEHYLNLNGDESGHLHG